MKNLHSTLSIRILRNVSGNKNLEHFYSCCYYVKYQNWLALQAKLMHVECKAFWNKVPCYSWATKVIWDLWCHFMIFVRRIGFSFIWSFEFNFLWTFLCYNVVATFTFRTSMFSRVFIAQAQAMSSFFIFVLETWILGIQVLRCKYLFYVGIEIEHLIWRMLCLESKLREWEFPSYRIVHGFSLSQKMNLP